MVWLVVRVLIWLAARHLQVIHSLEESWPDLSYVAFLSHALAIMHHYCA